MRACAVSRWASDTVVTGLVAAAVSGAPSTIYALVARRSPWEASAAAGSLLFGSEGRTNVLTAAAVPVHVGASLFWAGVLVIVLPRRAAPLWGALAGAGVAVIDLVVIGRHFPRIRSLPFVPQVVDHVAFGAAVATALTRRRTTAEKTLPLRAKRGMR